MIVGFERHQPDRQQEQRKDIGQHRSVPIDEAPIHVHRALDNQNDQDNLLDIELVEDDIHPSQNVVGGHERPPFQVGQEAATSCPAPLLPGRRAEAAVQEYRCAYQRPERDHGNESKLLNHCNARIQSIGGSDGRNRCGCWHERLPLGLEPTK